MTTDKTGEVQLALDRVGINARRIEYTIEAFEEISSTSN